MSGENFTAMAERFGLWAALCVALILAVLLFAWRREVRMANRIDKLENDGKESDVRTSKALESNGECLRQIVEIQREQLKTLQELNIELRCRPCVAKFRIDK
jgi:hypothetical protein